MFRNFLIYFDFCNKVIIVFCFLCYYILCYDKSFSYFTFFNNRSEQYFIKHSYKDFLVTNISFPLWSGYSNL